jgi:hypothetical protein
LPGAGGQPGLGEARAAGAGRAMGAALSRGHAADSSVRPRSGRSQVPRRLAAGC